MKTNAEEALRDDPAYVAGLKKIDQKNVREHSAQLENNLAVGIAFHNALEDAIRAKARTGKLEPSVQSHLVQSGRDAVAAFERAQKTIEDLNASFSHAGLDAALNRHIPDIFKDFDTVGNIQSKLARFRSLGAREDSLKCVRDELAKDNFNVLHMRSADGTLAGLVKTTRIADVQNLVDTIQKQGLPTVMGAGSGGAVAGGVVGTLLVIGGIIIVLSWFV